MCLVSNPGSWARCLLPPVSKIQVLTVGTLPMPTPTNLLDLPMGPMLSGLHSCSLISLCPDVHTTLQPAFNPKSQQMDIFVGDCLPAPGAHSPARMRSQPCLGVFCLQLTPSSSSPMTDGLGDMSVSRDPLCDQGKMTLSALYCRVNKFTLSFVT